MRHVTRTVLALSAAAIGLLLAVPGVALGQAAVPTHPDVVVEVLTTDTIDATALEVAADGRVVFAELAGAVKVWHQDGTLVTAGTLDVELVKTNQADRSEGGIHGLALAPDFVDSGELYLYFSVPDSLGETPTPPQHADAAAWEEEVGLMRLSRFTLVDDQLDLSSEEVVFEVPFPWYACCHNAGDLDWLPDGTLALATGDTTTPNGEGSNGYTPIDERPGRAAHDAQRTAQNPADRRGKVLRLDVEDVDGDGDILPDGVDADGVPTGLAANPFTDDPAYDPFVYAEGFRNPYRIAVDEATGAIVVANYGPDASQDDPQRGPRGLVELEVVPPDGGTNHGWPYCTADNRPYMDYDYATGVSSGPFSCEGFTPAPIFYGYQQSEEWPQLGVGLASPMAGVIYSYDGDGSLALPATMQDTLLFMEWGRQIVYTVTVEDGGLVTSTDAMLPLAININRGHDAAVGPDGAIYIAEYGGPGFYDNTTSQISRIRCAACVTNPLDYGLPAGTQLHEGPLTGLAGGEAVEEAARESRRPPLLAGAVLLLLAVPALARRRTVV